MTDVRDFEDDLKAGVPTIPVLLGSVLKTKVILTACHMLVMLAFIENPYIMGSCLFATVLVWMLGKDSPKKAFLVSSHSQSLFITWYLTRQYLQL
jgi:4-hydroxybenzoate polyprenyltransferase